MNVEEIAAAERRARAHDAELLERLSAEREGLRTFLRWLILGIPDDRFRRLDNEVQGIGTLIVRVAPDLTIEAETDREGVPKLTPAAIAILKAELADRVRPF